MIQTLTVIYSTSTGHTEFVVDNVIEALLQELPGLRTKKQRAEVTKPEELKAAEGLLLACGSWNTGNIEGQLSPLMHELLVDRAKDADLKGIPAAAIGLGDSRYHYTARAADKLTEYLQAHNAKLLLPTLKIINEPFEQKEKVIAWAKELAAALTKLPAKPAA